jgi:hypothetical protein
LSFVVYRPVLGVWYGIRSRQAKACPFEVTPGVMAKWLPDGSFEMTKQSKQRSKSWSLIVRPPGVKPVISAEYVTAGCFSDVFAAPGMRFS